MQVVNHCVHAATRFWMGLSYHQHLTAMLLIIGSVGIALTICRRSH